MEGLPYGEGFPEKMERRSATIRAAKHPLHPRSIQVGNRQRSESRNYIRLPIQLFNKSVGNQGKVGNRQLAVGKSPHPPSIHPIIQQLIWQSIPIAIGKAGVRKREALL